MGTVHSFHVSGTWSGNRLSVGQLHTEGLSTTFSVPTSIGGPGIGTNPEELLLSAAAGCYLITLAALLSNRQVPFLRIDLESNCVVDNDRGLRVDKIEHRPTILLQEPFDEAKVMTLAEHAEHACMVSSAIRGNVSVTVTPSMKVQTPTP